MNLRTVDDEAQEVIRQVRHLVRVRRNTLTHGPAEEIDAWDDLWLATDALQDALNNRECVEDGCHVRLVQQKRWLKMTTTQRKDARAAGYNHHQARGLCAPHYATRQRNGTLVDVERNLIPREELLEEWAHFDRVFDSHTAKVRAFAERIGRTWATTERALLRAGVTAANPHGPT